MSDTADLWIAIREFRSNLSTLESRLNAALDRHVDHEARIGALEQLAGDLKKTETSLSLEEEEKCEGNPWKCNCGPCKVWMEAQGRTGKPSEGGKEGGGE